MRQLLNWFDNHILKIGVSLIIVTVAVYPKFPIISVSNTWVYIRLEDFLIAITLFLWIIQFLRKKVNLKTPLSKPIIAFFIAGAISTLWAIIFRDPKAEFFPHLAILSYLRRIEYLAIFFLIFSSVTSWKVFKDYLSLYFISTLAVNIYGLGQRYFNLPAFSTMNQEFAKGIPLYLTENSRVLSTFAGHYDFAAFLVLIIALFASLAFAVHKKRYKFAFIGICILSLYLLLLTFSRVSFIAYLVVIVFLILFQRIKWFPKVAMIIFIVGISILGVKNSIGFSDRFAKMIAFNKNLDLSFFGKKLPTASSSSDLMPLSDEVPQPKVATGASEEESTVVPIIGKPAVIALPTKRPRPKIVTITPAVQPKEKEKAVYVDRSTSTRFDAEWPRAINAFKKNPILGTGYSSITLATDNDYLRLLGETGLAGFLTFGWIFLSLFTYLKSKLKEAKRNNFTWIIIIATSSVTLGMLGDAVLIDVFEASKVAITFWGILALLLSFFKIRKQIIDG